MDDKLLILANSINLNNIKISNFCQIAPPLGAQGVNYVIQVIMAAHAITHYIIFFISDYKAKNKISYKLPYINYYVRCYISDDNSHYIYDT